MVGRRELRFGVSSVVAEFICGCRHEISLEDIGWWREVSTDSAGFVICVRHRVRRKNWRSLPEIDGNRSDWTFAGVNPLDYEQWLLFAKALPKKHFDSIRTDVPDRRDNRDPEEIGRKILAKGNGG
jgi:hypothetical protein